MTGLTDEPAPRLPWARYAARLAMTAADRSEDPYHRVGCCLLGHDNTVVGMGFNGAPPGIEIDWSDRDKRRKFVVHAEVNALRNVRPGDVRLMATTMMPCDRCVLIAAAYGVKEIVYVEDLDPAVYDVAATLDIAETCGISITREETGL